MSRSWVDTWRVGLAPEAAEALHVPRFTAAAGPPQRQPCAATPASAGGPAWAPVLDAMDQVLQQAGAADAAADVVISNHFVRYLMIPWQPAINRRRELEELAALRMGQVFGDAAARWTVRCSEGGYGEPSVACAVDSELISTLNDRLAERRLRLRSLQPLFMAAGNQVRRRLGRDAAFALAESGRLCVGLVRRGALQAVASRRATAANATAVAVQELSTFGWEPTHSDLAVLRVGDAPPWPNDERVVVRELAAEPRPLAACGMA